MNHITMITCLLLSGSPSLIIEFQSQSLAAYAYSDEYDVDHKDVKYQKMNVNRRDTFKKTVQQEASRDRTVEWAGVIGVSALLGWLGWRWFRPKRGKTSNVTIAANCLFIGR
ncbi:hypothetical protein GCM10011571_11740 [Marinithermofilum abyssi]|jgi:hypothetical protein|uniref:Uncharacterized protein n=1 Tax=Marinithermofilum abyssi TaxID=1571185 RepID=A0A8J2VGV8_9BACL|nr:hypothetical protein [Marinithermofilum abyssi]GGE12019.1 hypothetical protein GCM10011571_11740 [Marinithermofilum abyssi]